MAGSLPVVYSIRGGMVGEGTDVVFRVISCHAGASFLYTVTKNQLR